MFIENVAWLGCIQALGVSKEEEKERRKRAFENMDKSTICPPLEDQDTMVVMLRADPHVRRIFSTIRKMTLSGAEVSRERVIERLMNDRCFKEMRDDHHMFHKTDSDARALMNTACLQQTFHQFGKTYTMFYDFVLELLISMMEIQTKRDRRELLEECLETHNFNSLYFYCIANYSIFEYVRRGESQAFTNRVLQYFREDKANGIMSRLIRVAPHILDHKDLKKIKNHPVWK